MNKYVHIPSRNTLSTTWLGKYHVEVEIYVKIVLKHAVSLTIMLDKGNDQCQETGMNILAITEKWEVVLLGTCQFGKFILFYRTCE